jgi:hypothetical protein
LNFVFAGFCGVLSFVAFSLWTLALSRNRYLALIPPLLLIRLGDRFPFDLNYPAAVLPGTHWVYSMFSVSYAVLSLAMLGLGRYPAGLFLLGFSPAVHPMGGLWALGIGLLALAWDRERRQTRIVQLWPYLLGGFALFVASFAVQYWLSRGVPTVSVAVTAPYVEAFLKHWDDHRVPAGALQFISVAIIAFSGMALSVLWLYRYPSDLGPESRFLLRAYLLAAGIGIALGGAALLMDVLPEILKRVIPGRYVNLALLTYIPLLIGILGATRRDRVTFAVLSCFVVGVILNTLVHPPSHAVRMLPKPWRVSLLILLLGSAIGCVLARWTRPRRRPGGPSDSAATDSWQSWGPIVLVLILISSFGKGFIFLTFAALLSILLWRADSLAANWPAPVRRGTAIVMGLALIAATVELVQRIQSPMDPERRYHHPTGDWTNDEFFRAVHDRPGSIMTGGHMVFIQLVSRRPVLLLHPLNFVPYFPETGPDLDRVLRAFFGFGLSDPPPEVNHQGLLPAWSGQDLWEQRSVEEWCRLAGEFQVSGVVTNSWWYLKLPVIAKGQGYILYGIPGK